MVQNQKERMFMPSKKQPARHPDLYRRLERMVGHAQPKVAAAKPTGLSRGEHQQLVDRLAGLLDDTAPARPTRHRRP
jgi:hypothetical protein